MSKIYKSSSEALPEKSIVQNAIIKSVSLSMEDHGLLTSFIHVEKSDGWSQGFGGYALYLPKTFDHHKTESFAGHFIARVLSIAGVERWDDVVGKAIRVCDFGGKIIAIGNIIKDDWFIPEEDFRS